MLVTFVKKCATNCKQMKRKYELSGFKFLMMKQKEKHNNNVKNFVAPNKLGPNEERNRPK